MKQFRLILIIFLLCQSVLLSQEKFPRFLPKVDTTQIWHSIPGIIPENSMEYDPLIDDIINQTNLDSLVSYVRILSGEESVWIEGSEVLITHRVSDLGNDLAADYIKNKLESFELEVYDQSYSLGGRNVYAIQPGYLFPETQFIICAHYDAVADYCADDNASGVAAVLEAARILSKYDFKYTLIYALWDEEEIGFYGSQYYASQASSNQAQIQGVLNLDMIAWDGNDDQLADIHTQNTANSNDLANLLIIVNWLYELPLNLVIYNPGTWQSDHGVFWNSGWGAILLIEAYYGGDLNPYYHSSDDRIDKISLPYFHNLSRLSIAAISTLIEVTRDTLLASVAPDKGYQTYSANLQIKGVNTHFEDNPGTMEVWLSKDSETITADSLLVNSNTSLNAYFYIPVEASTGLWDVNVKSDLDGIITKVAGFNILPSPALIFVSPESLIVNLEAGQNETRSLTIHNSGASDLNFTISGFGPNYALQFDGIDDYVDMGSGINLANSSITFEAWVKRSAIGIHHFIWGQGSDFQNNGLHIGFRDNDVFTFAFYANDLDTPTNYSDLDWHHWACTFDKSTKSRKIFRDGLEVANDFASANYQGSGNLYIGIPPWYTGYFDGIIDEARVWNVTRTQNEIQQFMHRQLIGSEPNLVGYWPLNERTGITAYDMTANANNGILKNGVSWINSDSPIMAEWLSVEPDTGVISTGSSTEITLSFDAKELDAGEYDASLLISSNDPFTPVTRIPIHLSITPGTGIEQELTTTQVFKLYQNYPNPFNPITNIQFSIPKSDFVTLEIYNLLGQEVTMLVNEKLNVGSHSLFWNAAGFASGVYLYRLQAGNYSETKKLILLR